MWPVKGTSRLKNSSEVHFWVLSHQQALLRVAFEIWVHDWQVLRPCLFNVRWGQGQKQKQHPQKPCQGGCA